MSKSISLGATRAKDDVDQSSAAYDDATKLLEEVVNRFKTGNENEQQDERIESLITKLIAMKTTYDPMESLYGPMYCSLYMYTPGATDKKASQPLWEKLSLKKDNLKGQQYFCNENEFNVSKRRNVINYAEIYGNTFHITARGYFVPVDPQQNNAEILDSPIGGTRNCPDKYEVSANGAAFSLFNKSITLPIEGSSYLVVGYADPRLRIFISPKPSDSIVGEWESAGLIVVQVRSDLVTKDGNSIELS